jgi:tetratricopeptide (TPR) repeat protein
MELTIEQALQQGLAAHKEGKLQEAERSYRAILQSQPAHPDANHNLGVLAVSVNKADAALPLFKTALEANPKMEQFWLSYIEALIKEKQFDNAKAVLEQAKQQGVAADRLNSLEAQLSPKTQIENVNSANPSQQKLNSLLEYYQNGRFGDAEKLSVEITQDFPKHQFSWKVLGAVLRATGRKSEAVNANQTAVSLSPQDAEAHYNLGITLQELGRLDEAEASFKQAIALKPDFAEAHSNLGNTLKELGRLDEALASYTQAIALKPDFAEAHNNLGVTLHALGRLDEAKASYTQAISLKPDVAEAHHNLGNTLKELGRLDEALASYTQAIALKPDYAEAHYNLGITLKELGRLDEAEASYTQAIALKPDYAEAHYNLGIVLYISGDTDSALVSMKKANSINPELDTYLLINSVVQARKSPKETGVNTDNILSLDCGSKLSTNPLILSRLVESELITVLLQMKSRGLDRTSDARYGNGRCSPDFNFFKEVHPIIRTVAEDLTSIMKSSVKSDIYCSSTFFNILSAGGGSSPHNHLKDLDGDHGLFLGRQKYSLVYYLSVGDQNCSEPGTLKLFAPDEDILPREGMIIIIPAGRKHSAVYDGETDRIMIGVNFYSI